MKTSGTRLTQFTIVLALSIFLVAPCLVKAQQGGTFKDSRDNHVYQTIKMGKKTWMAENLKFVSETGSWVYNNDTVNQRSFGRLYDWKTATTACPKGWNLPSDSEWASLLTALTGKETAGGKLQQLDSANQSITKKINENGKPLSTLLGGIRHGDGTYTGIGLWGGFWSGTSSKDGAINYLFAHGDKSVSSSTNDKASGFSVRCIKK